MSRNFLAGLLTSAILLGAPLSSALAADMPVKAPLPAPVPAFSWTGWYVGGNAGGVWGNSDPAFVDNDFCPVCFYYTFGPSQASNITAVTNANNRFRNNGFTGGGQFGYNFQTGLFVLGAEADFEYFHPRGSNNFAGTLPAGGIGGGAPFAVTDSASANWLSTLRARIGVTTGHWLFFATAGAAVARVSFSESYADATTSPPLTSSGLRSALSTSVTKAGTAAGGGIEYAIDNHWLVRAEYLFVQINEGSLATLARPTTGNLTAFNSIFTYAPVFRENIARAALSYKF